MKSVIETAMMDNFIQAEFVRMKDTYNWANYAYHLATALVIHIDKNAT